MKNILKTGLMLGVMLAGCAKNPCDGIGTKLTEESRTGANTMSCKIDDKIWIALGSRNTGNCRGGVRFPYKNFMAVDGSWSQKCANIAANVEIVIDTSAYSYHNGVKRYKLIADTRDINRPGARVVIKEKDGNSLYYKIQDNDKQQENWLELTRNDTQYGIVSGWFEFVAYPESHNPNQTPIRITEGRFDWDYTERMPCVFRL